MRTKPSKQQVQRLWATQGGKCFYCGAKFTKEFTYTIDHFVPKSRSGKGRFKDLDIDSEDNKVLACGPCNYRKASKILEYKMANTCARCNAPAVEAMMMPTYIGPRLYLYVCEHHAKQLKKSGIAFLRKGS